jgi:hypothetical protein
MYYTIYKITNFLNNKEYIGSHKTSILEDQYMGSGVNIRRAISKYGIENFTKDILFVFESEDEMFLKEQELVTEDYIKRKDTYNIMPGGFGGWSYVNSTGVNRRNLNSISLETQRASKQKFMSDHTKVQSWKEKLSKSLKGKMAGDKNPNYGNKHSDEARAKMKGLDNHKGEKNSQFGTIWVTNGKITIKIKSEEIEKYLNDGYRRGRNNTGD